MNESSAEKRANYKDCLMDAHVQAEQPENMCQRLLAVRNVVDNSGNKCKQQTKKLH